MSQATGVKVSFGVNAYYVNPDPSTVFSVLIDPSYLNGDAEYAPFISLVTIRWK